MISIFITLNIDKGLKLINTSLDQTVFVTVKKFYLINNFLHTSQAIKI